MDRKTASQCISADYCRGWNDAVSEMEESGGWISVEDGLPEEKIRVLVSGDKYPTVIGWIMFGEWATDFGCMYKDYPVTHWMPLPKPPKRGDVE